ncbi:ABC transporter G family member 9-like [Papaver somniferum]|uniref:ABC transporter G family member 9-like n=1 Tax=Papaver somniferum TaxID=3469 RepID=UPI000E6F9A83|nr:ABC transporter G family member 9-like [Papaver somniferum]
MIHGDDQTKSAKHESSSAAMDMIKKVNRPVTLKFQDVSYEIKLKNGAPGKGKVEKTILKGITGSVQPGEMLALLGPSGSGKTTLLSALGGRLGGRLTGNITYNGKPVTNSMNRNTGFVTQDDKFHVHLTVTETLVFTALLRLPKTLSKDEKIKHAEEVINQLGLTKCKNTIMGGPFLRGVSGGERKRVSIGQEILINPSLLFLDEPTSGLDSTSAQQVVTLLWELAKGGRTVLMSIHQPSSRLYYMFSKILVLSEGNPLYFGKGEETMDYFSGIGYSPSVTMNPADFLLDLANGVHMDEMAMDKRKEVKQQLVSAYKHLEDKVKRDVSQEMEDHLFLDYKDDSRSKDHDKDFDRWSTSWGQQFWVLLRRDLKQRKNESFSFIKITQILVMSLLCGLLWWKSSTADLQDQIGLLFFYSMMWGLIPLFQALFTFPQEKLMLTKERSSGMYRLSSYFMARSAGDLPMELALPFGFIIITYWMAGLKPTAFHFFKTSIAILYTVLVSHGVGLAIGALVMNLRSATITAGVIVNAFFLVGGYYVRNVPKFIAWLKYISVTYHSYKLLLSSQYKSDEMYACGPNTTCKIESNPTIEKIGLGGEAISYLSLTAMLVVFRTIAYLALIRVGKVSR